MEHRNKIGYAPFYRDIELYPEAARFRRFGAQLAKKLYDDTEEVLLTERVVNEALARSWTTDSGVTVLDIPRSIAVAECAKDPEREGTVRLKEKWTNYEGALMKYSETLCLSHQVLNLPHQAPYAAMRLAEHDQVFDKHIFGPTSEADDVYLKPSHLTDTCAWRGLLRVPLQEDLFTTQVIKHAKWIEKNILSRLRRLLPGRRKRPQPTETNIQYHHIVATIDILACVFVPFLLTAAMFALAEIGGIRVRTSIVGVFGLIFSLSVKAIAGHPTRGEVFAANAAFFAVASVFVESVSRKGAD